MLAQIESILLHSRNALDQLIGNKSSLEALEQAAKVLAQSLQQGGRAFSCGNGGSMSDAMHFAEELTGRFQQNRRPLAATAISDPGHLSCVANDFGYEYVFSRYIEAHGRRGDFLLAISTSGTSQNVIKAAESARARGLTVVSLTGKPDTALGRIADVDIPTPSGTPFADRVQELHIKCIHILIELCEQQIFTQSEGAATQ